MLAAAAAVTALNRTLFRVVKWLVFVIVVLMLWEVVSRYAFNAPTGWGPELATLLFGPYFLLGGPWLLHVGGHVAVDILSAKAGPRTGTVLAAIAAVMALVFGAILTWFALPLAWQSWSYGETSFSAWNPVIWPAKAMLPLATILLSLQAAADLVFLAHGDARRREAQA